MLVFFILNIKMKNFCEIHFENFNQIGNVESVFNLLIAEIHKRYDYENIELYQDFSTEQSAAQVRMILYDNNYEWLIKHPKKCLCINITFEQNIFVIYKYCGLNLFKYFQSGKGY